MFKNLRRWWQVRTGRVETPLDGEVPFWILSFLFHVGLLLLLAWLVMPPEDRKRVKLTIDTDDVVDLQELPPEIQFDEIPMEEVGADGELTIEMAASEAPELAEISEDPVELDQPTYELGDLVTADDIFAATGETISSVPARGAVGTAVTGASGAVDRITREILLSLDERKTMVVWLFDESASLLHQRGEILSRFDKIYQELGILQAKGNESFKKHDQRPLLTAVYGFGADLHELTSEPTDDLEQIKNAIGGIGVDRSGVENVFSAILAVSNRFSGLRRINRATGDRERNVLLIVVSDEAGDDGLRLEECIAQCNKHAMPVYVIGVPAPFGRDETLVKWVDPDPEYDQTPQLASVSQGPESVLPERIQLDYAGNFDDLEMIDSGFGPFNLTRLCYETGGIYFAVHPNRRTSRAVNMRETANYSAYLRHFFDPEIMRRYKPDYVSRATYLERLKENRARAALVEAAAYSSTGVLQPPILEFPKLDEAAFVRQVTEAQQYAAFVEPKLEQLYEILKVGEQDRELETSRRWQAGYDLAMGRVLAAKLRANAYNDMLAMSKLDLKFKDEKNNTWVLRPANSITTGSAAEKLAARARMYLNRVVTEHPGTPWALLAQRDLATPIGYEWTEKFTPPPEPPEPRANNNPPPPNPNRPMPQPRPNAMPKPKRPPPKL